LEIETPPSENNNEQFERHHTKNKSQISIRNQHVKNKSRYIAPERKKGNNEARPVELLRRRAMPDKDDQRVENTAPSDFDKFIYPVGYLHPSMYTPILDDEAGRLGFCSGDRH
jgi:hypothetical protein